MSDDLLYQRPKIAPVRAGALATYLGATLTGDPQAPVLGVSVASNDIAQNEAFIALGGFVTHGARFTDAAVAAGASVVITDAAGVGLITGKPAALIEVADPRAIVGRAAAFIYREPGESLDLYAVTGTNGKTTTVTILQQILTRAARRTGLFGTVEVRLGTAASYSPRTTLEATVVNRLLALARERQIESVALEVSSQALDLGRLNGLKFAISGFVNLQHDHLDYHGSMEQYFAAKAALFTPEFSDRAVICLDDEWGRKLAAQCPLPTFTVASGIGPAGSRVPDADLVVEEITQLSDGTRFVIASAEGSQEIELPLPSRVMVQNALVAIGMARNCGVDWDTIRTALREVTPAAGRMQVVAARSETHPLVIVDYAHTPDALAALLPELRAVTPGNLIIVFGSDGDRDREKRPILGKIAAQFCDLLYLTDESPRTEDPAAIRSQILAGVRAERPELTGVFEDDCRANALTQAILAARACDTVVVTGKGAEQVQIFGTEEHPYNDVPIAAAAISQR